MASSIEIPVDNAANIQKAIAALTRSSVLVGVPSSKTEREEIVITRFGVTKLPGEINNAALAYIHTNGSPEENIPARPFLVPGIRDAKTKIASLFRKAGKNALEGKTDQVEKGLEAAGLVAQVAAKKRITDGIPPPLKDSTLKRRGDKSSQQELDSREAGNIDSTLYAKPLIRTGQLLNSISYVVRKN